MYFGLLLLLWSLLDWSDGSMYGSGRSEPGLQERLGIDPWYVIASIVVLCGFAYATHQAHLTPKILGEIVLNGSSISVKRTGGETRVFKYGDLEDLAIRRRSSWQHEVLDDNYLVTFGTGKISSTSSSLKVRNTMLNLKSLSRN